MANTHKGQPPSNHITLQSTVVGNFLFPTDLRLRRINPNGTVVDPAPPFSVPVGQVLVVTDVDWEYRTGPAGQIQILKIDIQNISSGGQSVPVFYSAITIDNIGHGATTEAMTSGFIVSSDARILFSNWPGGGLLQDLIIRGYLCPES
jgi:hypothetical protein